MNAAITPLLVRALLITGVVLVVSGCRNTTNTALNPMGGSSSLTPLSPNQGGAMLSPLQPTSGIGTFGAPTRVAPPPTGAYSAPGGAYAAPPSSFGTTSSWTQPPPNNTYNSSPGFAESAGNFDSGVRQTGWVGDAPAGQVPPSAYNNGSYNNGAYNNGFDAGAPAPPAANPTPGPRSGGMQVIDLTQAPNPPGYTPPRNQSAPSYSPTGYPAAGYPAAGYTGNGYPPPAPPAAAPPTAGQSVPLGQPTNSTFVQSGETGFEASPSSAYGTVQTASRPETSVLPSTEPYPGTATPPADELQWRRPSPRF
ncbi:hypothetical protein NHH03_05530 [Stieleria sp. TO1_6]|uniref:hypothetical protein n=1 Tax=Stieleria tagensis TaxID=2956795 RepID=UPI00209B2781|nr:hypothetical protein [Stieleria tagensis]MCO8121190.1 hypothetical protein [Stieleria tagensis]